MRIPGKTKILRRQLLVGFLACTLIASGGIASADPASPNDTTTTESPPTTTTKPAPTTTEPAPPATATESAPATSTKPAPTTVKEVPREKIPPSGDALIAAAGESPPSAFEAADPPAREASPKRSGRDFSALSQQRSSGPQQSMTLDEIPALPAGVTPRSETEPVADGFTKEEADLSERMEYALNEGCQTYWPSPYAVCGEIRNKYNAMGGPSSFLNFPKSPEYQNPGATGFRSEFVNGSIYWSPSTGAHPVTLLYMSKWAHHGWETGMLGYPTNDEIGNNDGQGSHQEFQGAGVYWHPIHAPLAAAIGGAIRAKWDTVGAENGPLGYPNTDEIHVTKNDGRYNNFSNGTITWSIPTGARLIYGLIRDRWAAMGREDGSLGYPTGDEQETANGTVHFANFEDGGAVYSTALTGAWYLSSRLLNVWASEVADGLLLGYPIGNPQTMEMTGGVSALNVAPDDVVEWQRFEYGRVSITQDGTGYSLGYDENAPALDEPLDSLDVPQDSDSLGGATAVSPNFQPFDDDDDYDTSRVLASSENKNVSYGSYMPIRAGYYNSDSDTGWGYDKAYWKHDVKRANGERAYFPIVHALKSPYPKARNSSRPGNVFSVTARKLSILSGREEIRLYAVYDSGGLDIHKGVPAGHPIGLETAFCSNSADECPSWVIEKFYE